jgi:hypothetical protein
MSFEFVELTEITNTASKHLSWVADYIIVRNNTPYQLYINWRTTQIPNRIAFDDTVPAGVYYAIPVKATDMGFFLDVGTTTIPAIGQVCLITIQADEASPAFGRVNFQTRFTQPTSIAAGGNIVIDILTADSAGVRISFENQSPVQCTLEVFIGNNGVSYTLSHIVTILGYETYIRELPVISSFIRVIIRNNTGLLLVGVFTYTLLDSYSATDIPIRTLTRWFGIANLASAGFIESTLISRASIDYILVTVTTPAASPDDLTLSINLVDQVNNSITLWRRDIDTRISPAVTTTGFVGAYESCLVYHRGQVWVYEIPIHAHIIQRSKFIVINGGANILPRIDLIYGYGEET